MAVDLHRVCPFVRSARVEAASCEDVSTERPDAGARVILPASILVAASKESLHPRTWIMESDDSLTESWRGQVLIQRDAQRDRGVIERGQLGDRWNKVRPEWRDKGRRREQAGLERSGKTSACRATAATTTAATTAATTRKWCWITDRIRK